MPVLPLRIEGPMQSWGHHSRFTERDTSREPTKSGILGLVCSALGRGRGEDISDLNRLKMAVRIDREGILKKDYHTTIGTKRADGSKNKHAVLSNRYYLSDACYLVLLEGDKDTLDLIKTGFTNPRWTLSLGRRSFPPSNSILIKDTEYFSSMDEALNSVPWLGKRAEDDVVPDRLRVVVECGPEESSKKMEEPLDFDQRKYGARYTRVDWVNVYRTLGGK